MYCKRIKVKEYRNIESAEIELCDRINILYGQNGSGKTNIAEALYYFAIAKSFRAASDRPVVRNGDAQCALIEADFIRKNSLYGSERVDSASIVINRRGKNVYEINGMPYTSSGFMGNFKAVLYTPETIELVKGAPADRRRFLDIALCQFDPDYLECLKKYNFAVKERGECVHNYNLIRAGKALPSDPDMNRERLYSLIGVYTDMICKYGAYVIYMRANYIKKLSTHFSDFFRYVYGRDGFDITLRYMPAIREGADTDRALPFSYVRRELIRSVRETYDSDIERGIFPYGPAKDDLIIMRGDHLAKDCTSQGQQKVIAIALKTAEGLIYKEEQGDLPFFILDDIMSELDRTTQLRLTEMFSKYQTLITSADSGYVGSSMKLLSQISRPRLIEVNEGKFKVRKDFF